MNDPDDNINRILSEAANNLRIPTETAQMIMMVGAELLEQRNKINELVAGVERQRQAILRMAKEIDKLKGVHGA